MTMKRERRWVKGNLETYAQRKSPKKATLSIQISPIRTEEGIDEYDSYVHNNDGIFTVIHSDPGVGFWRHKLLLQALETPHNPRIFAGRFLSTTDMLPGLGDV